MELVDGSTPVGISKYSLTLSFLRPQHANTKS